MLPLRILRSRLSWLVLLGVALRSAEAAAASAPDDLCLGDPCVITGTHALDDNTIFDFDGRDLVIQGYLDVVPGGTGVTILASSITVGPLAQIRGRGYSSAPGGVVTLQADDDIWFQGALAAGAVVLSGVDGGSLSLISRFGSVTSTSKFDLSAIGNDGFGGTLEISAAGTVNLSGAIELQSVTTGTGLGGSADIVTDGNVSVSSLDLRGGSSGGGTVNASSFLGDVTLGLIRAGGGGALGAAGGGGTIHALAGGNISGTTLEVPGLSSGGGVVDLEAMGTVVLGEVTADGTSVGGSGGSVTVASDGAITLNGVVSARGNTTDGSGGAVTLTAEGVGTYADVTVNGAVRLEGRGTGIGGEFSATGAAVRLVGGVNVANLGSTALFGGVVDVRAQSLLSVTGPLTAGGGASAGGSITLDSVGGIDVQSPVTANGLASDADGGQVRITADGPLTLASSITANGGTAADVVGSVDLRACSITASAATIVESKGGSGAIFIDSGSSMALAGKFTAGSSGGLTRLRYGIASVPPSTAGAIFSPAATQVFTATLVPCAAQCGPVDTDGDGRGDGCDTCPYALDPAQIDRGGKGTGSPPDGIGDVCQCGDVNGDGRVTVVDATVATRALLNPPTASMAHPELCDVGGSLACTTADAVILRRAQLSPPTASLVQQCLPARH